MTTSGGSLSAFVFHVTRSCPAAALLAALVVAGGVLCCAATERHDDLAVVGRHACHLDEVGISVLRGHLGDETGGRSASPGRAAREEDIAVRRGRSPASLNWAVNAIGDVVVGSG